MASAAFSDFAETLELAKSLLALERRYKDPPRSSAQKRVAALRGAAAVLMVAALERYLRNLMRERFDELAREPVPVAAAYLPPRIWMHSVFASLELTMAGPRHGKPAGKSDRLPHVVSAAARVASGRIDPEAFADTRGNPGSQTVRAMFVAAGVSDVFARIQRDFDALWKKPEARSFVPDKLDEIVQRRHRVAHAAEALSISRSDLAEAAAFLDALATALDVLMTRHIRNVISRGQGAARRAPSSAGQP